MSNDHATGSHHVGDEGRVTLQQFLALACRQWNVPPPWKMPLPLIYSAARCCELYSKVMGRAAPLTRDFIDLGRVSYYGDTTRFRELVPVLRYRTIYDGQATL